MCGGESARMGFEKALIEVDGEPLVLRVARRLARVADPVLLATGSLGRLGPLGYPEVADERPGAGPLAGLAGGLAASTHELMAAVAVDMPFVSGDLLMLLAALHEDEDAVVPVTARNCRVSVRSLTRAVRARSVTVSGSSSRSRVQPRSSPSPPSP